MLDIAGAISKPRGTILPKKRRGTVLGKPGINRMDTSEVNMDYQAPDMSGYRNMDMGLEGYYKKGGRVGCGKAKRGFGRAMKGKK